MRALVGWLALLPALSVLAQQSPYRFKAESEIIWLECGSIVFASGLFGRANTQGLAQSELASYDRNSINRFDRSATNYWNPELAHISDGLVMTALTLPSALLLKRNTRKDWFNLGVLYTETLLLTVGTTEICKSTVRRVRPLVYNGSVPLDEKLRATSRLSFFSGHTSLSAASCFFAAKVFNDYCDNSTAKIVVWSAAALVPVTTGYLRYRAGKHFPTDVLMGYGVGAALGILVPHLHRTNRKWNKVALSPASLYGTPGFSLRVGL